MKTEDETVTQTRETDVRNVKFALRDVLQVLVLLGGAAIAFFDLKGNMRVVQEILQRIETRIAVVEDRVANIRDEAARMSVRVSELEADDKASNLDSQRKRSHDRPRDPIE